MPPPSVTSAAARSHRGTQSGVVIGATSTSPVLRAGPLSVGRAQDAHRPAGDARARLPSPRERAARGRPGPRAGPVLADERRDRPRLHEPKPSSARPTRCPGASRSARSTRCRVERASITSVVAQRRRGCLVGTATSSRASLAVRPRRILTAWCPMRCSSSAAVLGDDVGVGLDLPADDDLAQAERRLDHDRGRGRRWPGRR